MKKFKKKKPNILAKSRNKALRNVYAADLQLALSLHQNGNFLEAQNIYDQILTKNPKDAEVLHYRGVIALQAGSFSEATEMIGKSLAIQPQNADAQTNMGYATMESGNLKTALKHFNKALAIFPNHQDALINKGIALMGLDDLNNSASILAKAIEIKANPKAYYNLGRVQQKLTQPEKAIASYHQAIKLNPQYIQAYNNLSLTLKSVQKYDEAVSACKKALTFNPNFIESLTNMAAILMDMGQYDEAISTYKQVLEIVPDSTETHYNLGTVFRRIADNDNAKIFFNKAIRLTPDHCESLNHMGTLSQAEGKLEDAVNYLKKVLHSDPNHAAALNNLGQVYTAKGSIPEAINCFHQALKVTPMDQQVYSNLLFAQNYNPAYTQEHLHKEAVKWWGNYRKDIEPYKNFTIEPKPAKRLRIGYVSGDFRRHSVSFFFEPLITHHNRQEVEVFCYSEVGNPDKVTHTIKGLSDHWVDISTIPDDTAAKKIYNDNIDILVDLSGHTGHNRLSIFARRPAPVQVSWLGYPNTTGMGCMDYRLTDNAADPDCDEFYSEKLLRLPTGFLCFKPPDNAPQVAPLPALQSNIVTFGSFNNFSKINDQVMKCWSSILANVPDSRLLLKCRQLADKQTREQCLEKFTQLGIAAERILTLPRTKTLSDHLNCYNQVDIGLDTFPYNGTTTTCEALWMGVPVVVSDGDRHAGRVGKSIMKMFNAPELICTSETDYINKSISLATNLEELKAMRHSLRQKMQQSTLCDAVNFTINIEKAYRAIWHAWCLKDR